MQDAAPFTGFFATPPTVDPATGVLTYRPAADMNGTLRVSVVLADDGGTAGGGSDTSAPQTFTITVRPRNDAPSFVLGASPIAILGSGDQAVRTLRPASRRGRRTKDAGCQFPGFGQQSRRCSAVQPSIDADGTLRYAPSTTVVGTTTLTVTAVDDGGTTFGGENAVGSADGDDQHRRSRRGSGFPIRSTWTATARSRASI